MDALRAGFTVRNFAGEGGGAAHRAAPNRVLPAVSGFVSVGAGRPTEAHDSLHCQQSCIAGIIQLTVGLLRDKHASAARGRAY